MKILFVYFNRKQMCGSAEEAIEFINGLHYRNQEKQPKLEVNAYTEKTLRQAFSQEWGSDDVIVLNGYPYHRGKFELATTGCGITRILGYKPLADTVEEHDAIVTARDLAAKAEREERDKAEEAARLAELTENKRGWYHVELDLRLSVFNNRGNDYHTDKTFSGDIIADSGMDAYNKAVKEVENEGFSHRGNIAILESYAKATSSGYEFQFLGVKTDNGYSVEKWEEWHKKGEI